MLKKSRVLPTRQALLRLILNPSSEYLRLKYYCLVAQPDDAFWEGKGLAKRIAAQFATTKPFLDYINRAIDFSREDL